MQNNLTEFTHPDLYDAENRWGADDAFYLALAQRVGGPVLDIACGTGRLTRAIAAAGIPVTGMDIMQPMLDRAAALDAQGTVHWIYADCRAFQVAQRFRLTLMTSHAFQYLLTAAEQFAALACIRAHLPSGGVFAFETRNPLPKAHAQRNNAPHTRAVQDGRGRWFDIETRSRYDPQAQLETFEKVVTERATKHAWTYAFSLRYTPRDRLNQFLSKQGFTVSFQYGNWDASPVTSESPEIITICHKQ